MANKYAYAAVAVKPSTFKQSKRVAKDKVAQLQHYVAPQIMTLRLQITAGGTENIHEANNGLIFS